MKFNLLAIIFLISAPLYAATINLNLGDSITLRANSDTTVTCGGNGQGSNCKLHITNLNAKLDLCTQQLDTVEDCLLKYWPAFKKSYGSCVDEAFSSCIAFCHKSPVSLDCLDLCK